MRAIAIGPITRSNAFNTIHHAPFARLRRKLLVRCSFENKEIVQSSRPYWMSMKGTAFFGTKAVVVDRRMFTKSRGNFRLPLRVRLVTASKAFLYNSLYLNQSRHVVSILSLP